MSLYTYHHTTSSVACAFSIHNIHPQKCWITDDSLYNTLQNLLYWDIVSGLINYPF